MNEVFGFDNLNDYYDPAIKDWRLSGIRTAAEQDESRWKFVRGDIADAQMVKELFAEEKPELVVNLAAQAGVSESRARRLLAFLRPGLIAGDALSTTMSQARPSSGGTAVGSAWG